MNALKNNMLQIDRMDFSTVPTMPASAMRVLSLVFNEDVEIDELIGCIKQDIALTSEIIKVANSPIYRPTDPIENIGSAVMHLGLDQIKKIALTTSVVNTIEGKLSEENYFLILSYCMGTAAAAQILAERAFEVNPETAFLVGLFLNLGLFACAILFPKEFDEAKLEAKSRGLHFNTIIEERLSVQMQEITLQIAQQWKLPDNIIDSINCQQAITEKQEDPNKEVSPFNVISHLSKMAADVYFGSISIVSIEKFKGDIQLFLKINDEDATEILTLLSQEFNKLSSALDIDMPEQPSYTAILKKANNELLKINAKYEQMYQELSDKNQEMQRLSFELEKQNRRLKKLVTIDPLTSLYNRRFLEKSLERLISECRRYETKLSLIILDIDHFKNINDSYGHQAGDEVLIKTSNALDDISRQTDICARYGGEEFVILLPHTNLKEALIMAEKCRKALSEVNINLYMLSPMQSINITASFGVSTFNPHTDNADKLIQAADKLLYQAKQNGRNCVFPKNVEE